MWKPAELFLLFDFILIPGQLGWRSLPGSISLHFVVNVLRRNPPPLFLFHHNEGGDLPVRGNARPIGKRDDICPIRTCLDDGDIRLNKADSFDGVLQAWLSLVDVGEPP